MDSGFNGKVNGEKVGSVGFEGVKIGWGKIHLLEFLGEEL
jgi:hypothetical protein